MKNKLRAGFSVLYATGGLLVALLLEVALLYLEALRVWVQENRMFVDAPLHLLDTYNDGKQTPLEFDYFAIASQDFGSNWVLIPAFVAAVFWFLFRITTRTKLTLRDHGVNLLALILAFGIFAALGTLNWVEPFAITRALILTFCLAVIALAAVWTRPLIDYIALNARPQQKP